MSINQDEEQEALTGSYIAPLDIEGTNEILKQMQNSVCQIDVDENRKGTGFFCYINHENSKIPIMMTNNHVMDEDYIKKKGYIILSINNGKYIRRIKIDENRFYYSSQKYDTTIIELFPRKDNIKNFLELEDNIMDENSHFCYNNESVYLMHYPINKKLSVSYGILKIIEESEIKHFCYTDYGSSGSPILSITNKKIIGIHKEGRERFKFKTGTFLKYPINEFLENIKKY